MQRALSSGVTGMLTNQLALDVTSNNLANVNTPGFKGSRVTFATSLIQTTFAGSAAGNNVGGQNPRQVGLGVDGASIEVDMSQGALQATGRTLDLAIQGAGFFEVTDGTRSFYTRVGNFGLDEQNNLVHLSTGYRLIGNRYNLDVDNQGNQTLAATAEPMTVPVDDAFPPRRTSEIEFQGNLDSGTAALRGSNLTSIFALTDTLTNQTATEETALLNLNLFKGNVVPPSTQPGGSPEDDVVTMYVYGTRPDGEAYAGTFEINPWAPITPGSNRGTVGELVSQLNKVFSQGSDRFANARIENGNLLITSIGSGDGFSVFMGEGESDIGATPTNNPIPIKTTFTNDPSVAPVFNPAVGPGATEDTPTFTFATPADADLFNPRYTLPPSATPVPELVIEVVQDPGLPGEIVRSTFTIPAGTYPNGRTFTLPSLPNFEPGDQILYRVTNNGAAAYNDLSITTLNPGLNDPININQVNVPITHGPVTVADNEDVGLVDPRFTAPDGVLTQPIGISLRINGAERGNVIIPAGDYTGLTAEERMFRLPSFPHVSVGDTIQYSVISAAIPPGSIGLQTQIVPDAFVANYTNDSNNDGVPNMFQEGGNTDAHAWQYLNETNGAFDWYRARLVPEFVSSSIQVYDAQGGRHTVEARYFRVGTRTEAGSGAQINSWDVIVNVNRQRGDLVDDLVTGIEFDQNGRFLGVNATIYGTALSELTHVGRPSNQSIQVDWAATGPTTPATMFMNFGQSRTFNGLTGFGSASTAAAVAQDGYGDGKLDSLSVTPEGDIIALYTNGISRKLVQVPLTTFRNPEGLTGAEGNLWQRSTSSGDPIRRIPGENAGFITSSALEGSNVDIATEFTKLITSQRGFQVSARVIQTTDRILEELANLTR